MKQKIFFTVLTLVAASIQGNAFATNSQENDAHAIHDAKISLTKAISIAEQYANGKATHAALGNDNNRLMYAVEVVSGEKVMDVDISPESGKVLAAKEDKADTDEHLEKEDAEQEHKE
jgi:uncharacterized membrane protein YkoI